MLNSSVLVNIVRSNKECKVIQQLLHYKKKLQDSSHNAYGKTLKTQEVPKYHRWHEFHIAKVRILRECYKNLKKSPNCFDVMKYFLKICGPLSIYEL